MRRLENFISNFIERIENWDISFWRLFFLYVANFFLRNFFEALTSSSNFGRIDFFTDTFFTVISWWFLIFSLIILILYFLTKTEVKKVAKIVFAFSFIIYIPVIVDLFTFGFQNHGYIFITASYSRLVDYFLAGMVNVPAIGLGIEIEVFLAILMGGLYVFHKTKKFSKFILGAILIYTAIFFVLTIPVYMMSFWQMISSDNTPIVGFNITKFYLFDSPMRSRTAFHTSVFDLVDPKGFQGVSSQIYRNRFFEALAIFFLLCDLVTFSLLYYRQRPRHFFEMLKNFRPTRILHYFFLAGAGIFLARLHFGQGELIASFYDLLYLLSLFLAIFFACLFAAWENDEVDLDIDKISSPQRPLVRGLFEKREWRDIKFFFLLLALSFAWLAGYYALIFIITFILLYHFYSTPPLRLKRFIGLSSFLVALNALLAVWAASSFFREQNN
jgi:hypothetical protein